MADLAAFAALAEIDGPWWGEREGWYSRHLLHYAAAAVGVAASPDDFRPEWGSGGGGQVNLLDPNDGLAILAGRFGGTLEESPCP